MDLVVVLALVLIIFALAGGLLVHPLFLLLILLALVLLGATRHRL